MKTKKKTYRYTLSFTVETSREMTPADLEEKASEVWDGTERHEKLFVDSYGFEAEAKSP